MKSPCVVLIAAMLLGSCAVPPAAAAPLSVAYDGSTLPTDDPIAPWTRYGTGGSAAVNEGLLDLVDDGDVSWVLFVRNEPGLATSPVLHIEARVGRVVNEWPSGFWNYGQPCIQIIAFNPSRPPDNFGDVIYMLSLQPAGIDLRRHNPDGSSRQLGWTDVPDLASALHTVAIDVRQGSSIEFDVFVDGQPRMAIRNEPQDYPLNAIGFGHGFALDGGSSQWDYVNYWTEEPVPAKQASWGEVKATYRN